MKSELTLEEVLTAVKRAIASEDPAYSRFSEDCQTLLAAAAVLAACSEDNPHVLEITDRIGNTAWGVAMELRGAMDRSETLKQELDKIGRKAFWAAKAIRT